METTSLPMIRLTLIFSYQVTVTIGGDATLNSSRSCQDFEIYLTGTPQE